MLHVACRWKEHLQVLGGVCLAGGRNTCKGANTLTAWAEGTTEMAIAAQGVLEITGKANYDRIPETIQGEGGRLGHKQTQAEAASGFNLGAAVPNPAQDKVTIEITLPEQAGKYWIRVTDNIGQIMYKVALPTNLSKSVIEVKDFSSGLYFYSLMHDGSVLSTGKFVKQ